MYAELLSRKEYEVASLIAKGFSTEKIVEEYCISRRSVETLLYSIFKKLNLRNREELVYLFCKDLSVHKLSFQESFTTKERIDMILQLILWKQNSIYSHDIAKISRIARVHSQEVRKHLKLESIRIQKKSILVNGKPFDKFEKSLKTPQSLPSSIDYRIYCLKWDLKTITQHNGSASDTANALPRQ